MKCRDRFSRDKQQDEGMDFADSVSQTKQYFKDEQDINNIIARHISTGIPLMPPTTPPQFQDFSDAEDYYTYNQKIAEAKSSFESLPAHVRSRFDNDPGQLIQFVMDPNNTDEAIKLGLAISKPTAASATPQQQTQTPNQQQTQTQQ